MRRLATTLLAALAAALPCLGQADTLKLSTAYTTHVIFPTDLTYADLSNSRVVAAKIIEQNKNMLALKAKCEFTDATSVSALESNGEMHTFIVVYREHPSELVIDLRRKDERSPEAVSQRTQPGGQKQVSLNRRSDAPKISDIAQARQRLFHLGAQQYDVTVMCRNIVSYSDITYISLALENRSGISYEIGDATFVIESKKRGRRTVSFEKTLFPKSRYGTLSAASGETAVMVYSFDKMSLSKDQVLKVYFYEDSGQRNLVITIDTNDINKASSRL